MMNQKYLTRLALEAIAVGFLALIGGTASAWVVTRLLPSSVDTSACKGWNDKHQMELSLFLSGVGLHLLLEASGVNAWYIKKSASSLL